MYFHQLCTAFAKLPEVQAIALGGSRATGYADNDSDYDLYIYVSSLPETKERLAIIEKTCCYWEIANRYWEEEDDCVLKNNIPIDIIYRKLSDFDESLARTMLRHEAANAYTTCFWHNLQSCQIIYDPSASLQKLKDKYDLPYLPELKKNIIERGMRLLSGQLPSYDAQIIKAARRGDRIAVNHRLTAFIESYFDIIFALNQLGNPGEKRLLREALDSCRLLPKDFEANLTKLLDCPKLPLDSIEILLKDIVAKLKEVIDQ